MQLDSRYTVSNPNHTKHTHIMAYDTKTLELAHALSEKGEEEYRLLLELMADEILFKSKHPFKYWFRRFMNWVRTGDSTWDGAHYSEKDKYKDGYSYVR